jgi:putative sterol carrier protein
MISNAGMGYFNRAALVTGPGAVIGDGIQIPSVEDIHRHWDEINSLSETKEYENATVALGPFLNAFSPEREGDEAPAGNGLTVKKIFDGIPGAFQADRAAGLDVVFQFDISGPDGGAWHVIVKDGVCEVVEGSHTSPTTTIGMEDKDFVALISGELNAMAAYTSGKIKVRGDLMKSQLVEKLFKF